MKNSLLLIYPFCFLAINVCKAQQDLNFNKSIVHADKQVYSVSVGMSNHKFVNNTHNSILKTKNTYAPKHAIEPLPNDVRYDKSHVAQIFYDTFSESRLKNLSNEDLDLLIGLDVNLKGEILETSFSFPNNSSLTPVEIEKLETLLKKEIKFTLNDKTFKEYTYIPLHIFVNFKQLGNHTSYAIRF